MQWWEIVYSFPKEPIAHPVPSPLYSPCCPSQRFSDHYIESMERIEINYFESASHYQMFFFKWDTYNDKILYPSEMPHL